MCCSQYAGGESEVKGGSPDTFGTDALRPQCRSMALGAKCMVAAIVSATGLDSTSPPHIVNSTLFHISLGGCNDRQTASLGGRVRRQGVWPYLAMFVVATGLAACRGQGDAVASPDGGLPAISPSENVVTVEVQEQSKYKVDGAGTVSATELPATIRRSYARGGAGTKVMRVLGHPGVTGYDVVLAINAAREAGARRVDGIAEYSPGEPNASQKIWSEPMEPLSPSLSAAQPDTALR